MEWGRLPRDKQNWTSITLLQSSTYLYLPLQNGVWQNYGVLYRYTCIGYTYAKVIGNKWILNKYIYILGNGKNGESMNIPFHFVGRLMQHHCQKDGWCLQKGIFLQNEGYGKSISAHYQLFLSLQGYTLSLVKLVQWWKFGTYKMLLLFGALRFRLCPTILYPSKFLVPIHFVGFFQCPPFCVYKRGGLTPWG